MSKIIDVSDMLANRYEPKPLFRYLIRAEEDDSWHFLLKRGFSISKFFDEFLENEKVEIEIGDTLYEGNKSPLIRESENMIIQKLDVFGSPIEECHLEGAKIEDLVFDEDDEICQKWILSADKIVKKGDYNPFDVDISYNIPIRKKDDGSFCVPRKFTFWEKVKFWFKHGIWL